MNSRHDTSGKEGSIAREKMQIRYGKEIDIGKEKDERVLKQWELDKEFSKNERKSQMTSSRPE